MNALISHRARAGLARASPGPARVAGAALLAVCVALPGVGVAQAARTGKQIAEQACGTCHRTGEQGAPRIGDRKAWAARAAQGLTSLTQHAMEGIRKMPAHGGTPSLTDLDLGRAIAYMVNESGGHWVEPATLKDLTTARSGDQIVAARCTQCHQDGKDGAPRIGDRVAWTERMKRGLDLVVASAIKGHGGMPARGGMADASDPEIRAAVLYMFNRSVAPQGEAQPTAK